MPFITQGKANVKYLLIVGLVAAVSGGIIFAARNSYYKDIVSLNNFTEIKGAEKSIKLISPNGGEQLVVGKTYSITWEAKKVDKVMITLAQEGGSDVTEIITEEFPASSGRYSWIIPDNIKDINIGGQFRIFITARDDNGLTHDKSDSSFSITRTDETADWRTYRNEKMGFEIKYPLKGWGITHESTTTVMIDRIPTIPESGYFMIGIDERTLDEYLSDFNDNSSWCGKSCINKAGDLMVGGLNATKLLRSSEFYGTKLPRIFIRANNKSYIIDYFYNDSTYEQMISTFKVI